MKEGGYLVDTLASFMCNYGYNLHGSDSITCDQYQSASNHVFIPFWTSQAPSCELGNTEKIVKSCVQFKTCHKTFSKIQPANINIILATVTCESLILENGQIDYNQSVTTNGTYLIDTMANFSCTSGFSLSGSNSATCQASGSWNQQTPQCREGKGERSNYFYSYI